MGMAPPHEAGGDSDVALTRVVDIDALRALAPLPRAPVPEPSRPQPRTPQPRWSRGHSENRAVTLEVGDYGR